MPVKKCLLKGDMTNQAMTLLTAMRDAAGSNFKLGVTIGCDYIRLYNSAQKGSLPPKYGKQIIAFCKKHDLNIPSGVFITPRTHKILKELEGVDLLKPVGIHD